MTSEEKEALREMRNDARGAFIILAFVTVTIVVGLALLFRWVSG